MVVKQGGNGEVFIDAKPIQAAKYIDGGLRNAIMREGEHGLKFIPPADKVNLAITCSSIVPLNMDTDNVQVLNDMQATNEQLYEQVDQQRQVIQNLTKQLNAKNAGKSP